MGPYRVLAAVIIERREVSMKVRMLWAGVLILLAPGAMFPQPSGVLGDWKTKAGSIVRVERCGADVCLKLVQVTNTLGETTDSQNPDPALRHRPLCGLQIGSGFQLLDANHAKGGTLYDPKSGNTYRGKMTAEGSTLHLRGYIGVPLFGASEDWTRPIEPVKLCNAAER